MNGLGALSAQRGSSLYAAVSEAHERSRLRIMFCWSLVYGCGRVQDGQLSMRNRSAGRWRSGRRLYEVGIAVVEDNFFTRNETQNVSVATHRLIHLLEKGGGSCSHFSIDKGGGGIQEQTL